VLAVCLFAMIQAEALGPAAVGLAFSNTIQMLIFYTWSVRNMADAISLFSSTEKVGGSWDPPAADCCCLFSPPRR
jgi:hypothetical protein